MVILLEQRRPFLKVVKMLPKARSHSSFFTSYGHYCTKAQWLLETKKNVYICFSKCNWSGCQSLCIKKSLLYFSVHNATGFNQLQLRYVIYGLMMWLVNGACVTCNVSVTEHVWPDHVTSARFQQQKRIGRHNIIQIEQGHITASVFSRSEKADLCVMMMCNDLIYT